METHKVLLAVLVVAMAALIIIVDLLFFRDRFVLRLIVNIGIVLVCVALYYRFLS